MSDQIRDLAKRLQAARENAASTKRMVDALREAWEAEHREEISLAKLAQEQEALADELLRQVAIAEYQETQEIHLGYGVEVKQREVVEFNADDALAWAKQTGIALKLDEHAFKNIAKSSPESVPCATIRREPFAAIAKELEVAIAKEEEAAH